MKRDMSRILTRIFTVALLTMVSMGARADVKVVFGEKGTEKFEGKGGTIEMTAQTKPDADDLVTVTFTVAPDEGYIISMPDIEVYETIDPNGTRADLPQVSTQRELDGEEPYNLSAKRDYYITVKSNLGLWIKTVNFRTKYRNTKRGTNSVYFIANNGGYTSPTGNNYYMVPAADPQQTNFHDAYYSSNYTLANGDPEKPFIATYKTNRDNNSIWEVFSSGDDGYFYIKHWLTGKYLIYEPPYSDLPNRKSVHLQTANTPGENAKFDIASNGSIRPISLTSGNRFLNPAANNSDNYFGSGGDRNSAGLVGVWKESTGNSIWHLEETVEPPSFTINADGTVEMSSASGTTIRFTTDSSTPTASNGTVYSRAITITNEMTTINAVAINSESKVSNVVTLPLQIYTYYIVNRAGDVAVQHTSLKQAVGKVLNSYLDIPSAIRSPYLDGETIAFYTFSGDYLAANLTDENKITETPDADANIYVTYTTDHLLDKFLKLRGARAFNIKVNNEYIYDNNGTLAFESTDANKASKNHLWYFTGNDPYAVQVKNADTGKYLVFSTAPTFSLSDTPANFILMSGSTSGDGTTYDVVRLREATGNTTDNSAEISVYSINFTSSYYLIDKAGKLIAGPIESTSSELSLPDEWKSPLVSTYHYYTTSGYDNSTDTYTPTDEITNLVNTGDIYVTYDVSNAIDLTGGKTYMLKFSDGVSFNQEDGKDGIIGNSYKAVYPYNNGEFHLYVYGQEQWEAQLASGASTRTRWLWHILSDNSDPYHVIFKSEQNQTVKDKKEGADFNFSGNTYLRTYKPTGYGSVVTDVAYESEEYNAAYSGKMPTRWVNGGATEYMILGTSMLNMTLKTFEEIDGDRQIVTSFEQYWKNNPTANNLLEAGGIAKVTGNEEDVDLTTDQRTFLESANASLHKDAWHSYNVWAYTKPWEKFENGSTDKALKNGEHWLQTISMGSGNFTLEEVSLVPQVILLDQHGWEIVRVPMYSDNACTVVNTDALNKYNSPMVETYHWYPKASKRTGYHKYDVKDSEKEIIIYAINDKNKWVATDDRYTHISSSLSDIPYDHITSVQDKSVKTDFYVTYDVKPLYASSYTGAATADATKATPFILKQGGSYATTTDGSSITTSDRPENLENVEDNMQWYLKPNFDIDREMGYKYAGETGAQGGAKSKAETEEDNYNEGRNGFDPYNVQIQNKEYPLRYFTANTTDSKLDGGVWSATTSTGVSLQNMTTTNRQTATGYDQTTLNITNATFMVVADANGNMRLMPRFDHGKVITTSFTTSFTTLAAQASAAPKNDKGTGNQTLYTEMMVIPTLIHSSAEILQMNGYYVLASDFTCTASVGTSDDPFTGIIDGQLNTITGTISQPLVAYADGAIIKNVILDNVTIDETGNAGAIANNTDGNTRIYNCGILGGSVKGTAYTGGLVGLLDGTSRVINCYSYADITGGSDVGGIVGYNNVASSQSNVATMVLNCMFYGDITGGTNISPVYGGVNIDNKNAGGLATYNYYAYSQLKTKKISSGKYNCALAMEERFLNRCEIYRQLLNSNKKLAAIYATGDAANADQIAKWVLETADRTIDNPKPYPVLKPQGYYPSIINIDADNAPLLSLENDKPKEEDRNKGGRLGELKITISGVGSNYPDGASITNGTLTLQRTDKDFDRFNFNYDKVQLPYYNDVGTGNYTSNKVVTGWKITAIDGGTAGTYSAADNFGGYNFADRNCTNKDKFDVSGRVFSQGAYFDVPYGVTAITIEPYWGVAAYVSDQCYDVVYKENGNSNYSGENVTALGTQATNNTDIIINGSTQKVYTSIDNARKAMSIPTSGKTVYDYAVVLVGNVHQAGTLSSDNTPYTITSVDLDKDNEPDYSFIFSHHNRQAVSPIRFDFLNVVGTAQAQKPNGTSRMLNVSIFKPKGWFEVTNTCNIYFIQFEGDNGSKTSAPIIFLGGVVDQFTSTQNQKVTTSTQYIHLGSNCWFKAFGNGTHSDGWSFTSHVPVSVTGGDFEGFYLSGVYRPDAGIQQDNAECYISSGRFNEVAGAAQQMIDGDVHWQIYNADITNFYGGGINAAKPITGDITVDIFNSHVDTYCGGPKFGDMQKSGTTFTTTYSKNKEGSSTGTYSRAITKDGKVKTNATGCWFNKFFGAGYGGTSYSELKFFDNTGYNFTNLQNNYTGDRGKYFNGTNASYKSDYGNKGPGVATDFSYEFFIWSTGIVGARFYVKYASFSLAQCNDVESKLKKCIVENNFYGGGSIGKVDGTATSELEDCNVKGSVYAGGYSASLPTIPVRDGGFTTFPNFNSESGMFEPGVLSGTTDFDWTLGTLTENDKAINESDGKHDIYTAADLTSLGVASNTKLTIIGNTTVAESVYGGGEESNVSGNTNVNICAVQDPSDPTKYSPVNGTPVISGDVFGGGKGVADSFTCAKAMVGVNGENDGTVVITSEDINKGTKVIIGNGTVNGAVYGGGEVGRVEWNTIVKIGLATGTSGPVIKKDVFGAGKGVEQYGYAALVRGNTFVTIQGDAKVGLSVYGGGEIASVGKYNIATAEYASSHPEVEEGEPYSLANSGSGYCNVTIQGNAEIGPDNMKMTSAGGPDDAGHVFGAGKGVLPYENEDDFNCQKEGHAGEKHPGRMKPGDIWECYDGNENAYLKFVETLALATQTNVTIDGNAFVKGSVYGGSMNGHVQHDTQVNIKGGQIGCGKQTTTRHPDEVWGNDYTVSGNLDLECDSWPFEGEHLPYDIYKDSDGDGTPDSATDGHTFYGNVFGGGSGYYPYKRNPSFNAALAELGYGDGLWHREAGSVGGNTTVNITGGHILTSVYGGNEQTDVGTYIEDEHGVRSVSSGGKCTINMTGGTIGVPRTYEQMRNHPVTCYVFGAGKGDQRINFNTWTNVGSTELNISGNARIYGSTFGGGEDGHVIGNAVTNIGGTVTIGEQSYSHTGVIIGTTGTSGVDGNIFGGGRGFSETALTAGVVGGNVDVNISGGTMFGSVFGGGRLASVGTYFANAGSDDYGKMQADTETETHGHITVNISGGSIGAVDDDGNGHSALRNSNYTIGDVFGGSKGSSTDKRFGLAKSTSVTISEANAAIPTRINRSVFGGGEAGNVEGDVAVTLNGGIVGEDLYGGGALADTNIGNWNATLNEGAGGFAEGIVGEDGKTKYKTEVNLLGGTIKGDAFGGGLGQKTGFNGGTSDIPATTYGDITITLGKEDKLSATAFNITYENTGERDENNKPIQVVKSGRLFGTNNLNGSPQGNVTVNVYKTVAGNVSRTASENYKKKEGEAGYVAPTYELAAVYGGGNLANYSATGKKASVTIHTCHVSVQHVYGGGNAAAVPETDVLVKGAYEIEHVFGGGNGKDKYKKGNEWILNAGADVSTNTNTLLIGGYIHEAYGGSNEKGTIGGNVTINTNSEHEDCACDLVLVKLYGAGKNADIDGDLIVVLDCAPEAKTEEIYGGAENANVRGNVELTITSGTFGKVFGGNNQSGAIFGHIILNIEETSCRPIIIDELYGCGNNAAYSVYGYYQDGTDENGYPKYVPRTSASDHVPVTFEGKPHTNPNAVVNKYQYDDPVLNIISCTRIGKVFGGGLGSGAVVYGNPTVNINQMKGVWAGKTYGTGDDALVIDDDLGKIGDVFGGGNEAEVHGNTTVNIGTATTVQHHLSYNKDTGVYTMSEPQTVLGANIVGNVYGGGNKANVTGNTNVNIGKQSTP